MNLNSSEHFKTKFFISNFYIDLFSLFDKTPFEKAGPLKHCSARAIFRDGVADDGKKIRLLFL